MGKLTINSVSDSNISYEGTSTEMDEFIPLVSLRDPQKYNTKNDELLMDMDENGSPIFVDLLPETVDSQVNEAIQAIITKLEKPIIPFTVKKAGPDFTFGKGDNDGYISLELSLEKDKYVEVKGATASIKLKNDTNYSDKVFVKWEDEIDVEITITTKKSIKFYIRFLANDDKDTFEGDYENLFCGCFKVLIKENLKPVYYAISLMRLTNYRSSNFKLYRNILKVKNAAFGNVELGNYLATQSEKVSNDDTNDFHGELIKFLAIFSHGYYNNIFGDNDDKISKIEIKSMLNSDFIHFNNESVIFLGACNSGTGLTNSFAQELANISGAKVIGMVNDGVAVVKETRGKSTTPEMIYGPKMGDQENGKFYSFSKNSFPVEIGKNIDIIKLIDKQLLK